MTYIIVLSPVFLCMASFLCSRLGADHAAVPLLAAGCGWLLSNQLHAFERDKARRAQAEREDAIRLAAREEGRDEAVLFLAGLEVEDDGSEAEERPN